MICNNCNKEFSDKVYHMHIKRCKKSVKEIMKNAVQEVKKELKKDGKKSKKVK